MDGHHFDALTRALATRDTRRGVVARLAVLVGGLMAGRTAAAACPTEQIYRQRMGCTCKSTGRPPGSDGRCPCRNGELVCGGRCVNIAREPGHCGGCDSACPAARPFCVAGACVECRQVIHCPPPTDPCRVAACRGGACVVEIGNVGGSCDSGSACLAAEVCLPDGVCGGGVDLCPTCWRCDGERCVPDPDQLGAACDDGNACIVETVCQADGACGSGTDACPVCQRCDAGRCVPDAAQLGALCEDGDLCTMGTVCGADGHCGGGSPVDCTPPSACATSGVCDPARGCVFDVEVGAECDPGLPCVDGSTCQADGTCGGGHPRICNDPGPCQVFQGAHCLAVVDRCVYAPTPFQFSPCEAPDVVNGRCVGGTCLSCIQGGEPTVNQDCSHFTGACCSNACNPDTGRCH